MGTGTRTMMDLAWILRDFESSAYGAMAHAVDILMRVIDADAAVALTRDRPSQIELIYIGAHGLRLTPEQYSQLRKWPSSPRSIFWRQRKNPSDDKACLLKSNQTAESGMCQEVSQALAAADIQVNATCLTAPLLSHPACRVLFVRRSEHPSFAHAELNQIKRFTQHAAELIKLGYRRELERRRLTATAQGPATAPANLLDRLNATEHRVIQRLRLHETERQMAAALGKSPHTIHVHVTSIYRKLKISSRIQLLTLLDGDTHAPGPAND
jgi:DNA-binding CsgD family transcriptional regulator